MRSSMLRSLAGAMVALALALLIAAAIDAHVAVSELSRALINNALVRAERGARNFFEPATRMTRLVAGWAEDGFFDLDELVREDGEPSAQLQRWNLALSGLLESVPQLSGLAILDESGSEYSIVAKPDGWLVRFVPANGEADQVRYYQWTSLSTRMVPAPDRSGLLDVHARPWLQPTLEALNDSENKGQAMQVRWTSPYLSNTTGQAAITASIATRDPGGQIRAIAVYTTLENLSRFTMATRLRESGMILVTTEEPLDDADDTGASTFVVGLPSGVAASDGADWRSLIGRPPGRIGVRTLADAEAAYDEAVAQDPSIVGTDRFSLKYRSEGEDWWGAIQQLRLDGDTHLWIAAIVPESDLLFGADGVGWGLVAILLLIFALATRRTVRLAGFVSTPLERLAHENERISRGDLEPGDRVQSHVSEIQSLAKAQERMREGLKSLMKLEGDLQLARQIQQRTLPQDIPEVEGFEIAGWSEPAEETGGDTWDVVRRADGKTWLFLADATGHGVGPALSVVQVRAMVRALASLGTPLADAVGQVNLQLFNDLPPGRFITMWFGELNPEAKTLATFSAGQAPLVHYTAANAEARQLDADTCPLGIDTDLVGESPKVIRMGKGDLFAVISDGVFEAENPGGEQMGVDRVLGVLQAQRQLSAQEQLSAVRSEVASFSEGHPPRDDQTIVLVRGR